MSRLADELYFAPKIKFRDLDLQTGNALPKQIRDRIAGFYLEPAIELADKGSTFAAGLLVVCAMDALALFIQGTNTDRVRAMCRKIPDLADDKDAKMFCESFRNGLVHQALVKNGCEFSSDIDRIARRYPDKRLSVNPKLLAQAVLQILDDYIKTLHGNRPMKTALVRKIRSTFALELNG